jgi:cytochrome P450
MGSVPDVRVHRSLTKALRLFDADRFRWLDEAVSIGPLVALRMGPVRVWVVTNADLARTMLVSDSAAWTRPPATRAPIRVGVGENLFTQSDRAWARLQPAVAPSFRKSALERRLADIGGLVDDEVRSIPHDVRVDLELAMGRMALRLAAWVLLGEELDAGRAEEIAHRQRAVVRWVGEQLGKLTGFLPYAYGTRAQEMKRHRAVLNAYADEVLAHAKRSTTVHDDVLGALLRARPRGKALSATELRGHVLGLFLAGNETTAAALSWALLHGARNPTEWTRLREDRANRTTPFLTESLRLSPAVWGIPRTPTKAGVTLSAEGETAHIRRGQVATIYLRGINRDRKTWPDPLRFDASRHDTPTAEQHRSLIPFGLGPRGCIGQHLALAEMNAALPRLAQHGHISIEEPVSEDPNFALRITPGLAGRFTATSNPAQPQRAANS